MTNSNSNSNNSHHASRLRPWQRSALENGRHPLPEAPGDRSWLSFPRGSQPPSSSADIITSLGSPSSAVPSEESSSQISANITVKHFHPQFPYAVKTNFLKQPVPLNYRFWPEDEMRRLIVLRNGGATWAAVFAAFPNRTPEALKQAYHKRRYPVERQMEIEAAEAASSSQVADVEKNSVE